MVDFKVCAPKVSACQILAPAHFLASQPEPLVFIHSARRFGCTAQDIAELVVGHLL